MTNDLKTGGQTPTPRTDAHLLQTQTSPGPNLWASADFARTLERELTEAKAETIETEKLATAYLQRAESAESRLAAHADDRAMLETTRACLALMKDYQSGGEDPNDLLDMVKDWVAAEAVLPAQEYEAADGLEDVVKWLTSDRDEARAEIATLTAQLDAARRERDEAVQFRLTSIRHLNRLATWAQQDPTGPHEKAQIQQWVLNEIKAALGGEITQEWQPQYMALVDENKALRAELEAMKAIADQKLCESCGGTITPKTDMLLDMSKIRDERDAALAQLASAQRQTAMDTECIERITKHGLDLESALSRHHRWHLDQTERSPVYFGDTIGQINADEYADSEMYEETTKALANYQPETATEAASGITDGSAESVSLHRKSEKAQSLEDSVRNLTAQLDDLRAQLNNRTAEFEAVRLCFSDASHSSSATIVHAEMLQAEVADLRAQLDAANGRVEHLKQIIKEARP